MGFSSGSTLRKAARREVKDLIRTPGKNVNTSRAWRASLRGRLCDVVRELHIQVVRGLDLVADQDADGDSDGKPGLSGRSDASHSDKLVNERTVEDAEKRTMKEMKRESDLRAEELVPVLRTVHELANQLARLQELHVLVVAALRLGEVVLEYAAVNWETWVVRAHEW